MTIKTATQPTANVRTRRTSRPTPKAPAAPDWTEILRQARQHFGIERFRPGQKEVLASVFAGHDTLALMPTGSGKSLTYQIPALFLPKPVLVVSPLIALMEDQQHRAEDAGVGVDKFDSTLTKRQSDHAHQDIATHASQLIYTTPERLENPDFLRELNDAGGISLLVVDEAHTIAQWGHDFRPAFLSIGEARKTLGNPPVLALTATATEEVQKEILESLHTHNPTVVNTGTERENLFFTVHPTVNNEAKLARIRAMVAAEQGTGIIYTASVRSANELFDNLKDAGISVAHYHGQMPTRERQRVQSEFMRGDHKVMIATKAFGLGIDKPDIRFVYHFEFPDSLETYYQEAGRAGRDGLPAQAVLLYRLEDKRIQSFFLSGRYPKPSELQAVYEALRGRVLTESSTEPKATPDDLAQSLADAATQTATELPAAPQTPSRAEREAGPIFFSSAQLSAERTPAPAASAVPDDPQDISPTPDWSSRSAAEGSAFPASETQPHHGLRPLVTALTIADETKVGRRRTQVILHLLRESGVIHRTRRGYALKAHNPPSAEQVEALLKTYVDRAQHDKDRLNDMMRYAETPTCRVHILRTHFDEPTGDPCLRCDNCATHPELAAQVQHPAAQALHSYRTQPQTENGTPIPEPTPAAGTDHHEHVHIIETLTGTYQTTRETPTLTASTTPAFHPGDQVLHKRFGPGKVLDVHDENVLVAFKTEGHKRLRADFLQSA